MCSAYLLKNHQLANLTNTHLDRALTSNPQMPNSTFERPGGGGVPPPPPGGLPVLRKYFSWVCFSKNPTVISYCMTLKIKVTFFMTFQSPAHDTKLILVSILTFFEDIKNVKNNSVTLTVDLGIQGHAH